MKLNNKYLTVLYMCVSYTCSRISTSKSQIRSLHHPTQHNTRQDNNVFLYPIFSRHCHQPVTLDWCFNFLTLPFQSILLTKGYFEKPGIASSHCMCEFLNQFDTAHALSFKRIKTLCKLLIVGVDQIPLQSVGIGVYRVQ